MAVNDLRFGLVRKHSNIRTLGVFLETNMFDNLDEGSIFFESLLKLENDQEPIFSFKFRTDIIDENMNVLQIMATPNYANFSEFPTPYLKYDGKP